MNPTTPAANRSPDLVVYNLAEKLVSELLSKLHTKGEPACSCGESSTEY